MVKGYNVKVTGNPSISAKFHVEFDGQNTLNMATAYANMLVTDKSIDVSLITVSPFHK